MKFLFWIVLIFFIIVKFKIVYYFFMCYFLFIYLVVLIIEGMINGEIMFKLWLKGFLYSIGGLYIFLILVFLFVGM